MQVSEILRQLIAFETITGNTSHVNALYDWVEEQCAHLPVAVERRDHNGYPVALITTHERKTPKIWLYAHVDVVPASPELFSAQTDGHVLYGRGAFDMKFALAVYIALFQEMGSRLANYDIGMMLVSDEEIGGFNGAGALADDGYSADVLVMPDGGDDLHLETRAKGVWHLTARAHGESAHGSRPWTGKNAIEILMDFLQAVRQQVFTPKQAPDHWHRTMTLGTISGGAATNQVPEYAEAGIDIRFIDDDDRREIEQMMQDIADQYSGVELETRVTGSHFAVDESNPYIAEFISIAERVTGRANQSDVSYGSSDARFFAEKGIPTLITRPTGGGMHSPQEWINLASLETFHQILAEYVERTTKKA